MNLFKRFKFYFEYKHLLKTHKKELLDKYNVRIDKINRIYTVINVPDESHVYGVNQGKILSETWLRNWLAEFDQYLINNDIKELTDIVEISQVDSQNFLLILEYKYLNIANMMYTSVVLSIIAFITFLVTLFIKII